MVALAKIVPACPLGTGCAIASYRPMGYFYSSWHEGCYCKQEANFFWVPLIELLTNIP
jgi:hypothetical protein